MACQSLAGNFHTCAGLLATCPKKCAYGTWLFLLLRLQERKAFFLVPGHSADWNLAREAFVIKKLSRLWCFKMVVITQEHPGIAAFIKVRIAFLRLGFFCYPNGPATNGKSSNSFFCRWYFTAQKRTQSTEFPASFLLLPLWNLPKKKSVMSILSFS